MKNSRKGMSRARPSKRLSVKAQHVRLNSEGCLACNAIFDGVHLGDRDIVKLNTAVNQWLLSLELTPQNLCEKHVEVVNVLGTPLESGTL